MKRNIILIFMASVLVFSLVACNQTDNVEEPEDVEVVENEEIPEDVEDDEELVEDVKDDDLVIDVGDSTKFDEEEINDAIKTVKDDFDIEGASLKKIWYDEEKSDEEVNEYLETGKGSVNNVEAENVIVILADFDVDSSGGEGNIEADTSYEDWQFVLIRDSDTSEWEIDDSGY